MKNIHLARLSFIGWFLFPCIAISQNQPVDSLKNLLATLPQDTARVNVLNTISIHFIQNNQYDSSFRYAMPAMELSEKLHYPNGQYGAYHNLSEFYLHTKEYKIGKFFLLKSLDAALPTNNKKNITSTLKLLADLNQLQGNFKKASDYNARFLLYRDSLANEENARQAAEVKTEAELKQKTEATAGNAKTPAPGEGQSQGVMYISLAVLLVLGIVIFWLLMKRAKLKASEEAALLEADAETERNNVIIKNQKQEEERLAFLQRIAEKEAAKYQPKMEEEVVEVKVETDLPVKEIAEEKVPALKEQETTTVTEMLAPATPVQEKYPEMEPVAPLFEEPAPIVLDKQYSSIIYPGQLLDFSAQLTEDKIKLVWTTANGDNITGFRLEKSADGNQFVCIESIAAQRFGDNRYETSDLQPIPGTNYYRLEVLDLDGNFLYSAIEQIAVLPKTTHTLIAFPTHVENVVMVTASGSKQPVSVNIYDATGRKQLGIEVPPVTTPVYLTGLVAGTYTLQLKCQGKTVLQQLVKLAE